MLVEGVRQQARCEMLVKGQFRARVNLVADVDQFRRQGVDAVAGFALQRGQITHGASSFHVIRCETLHDPRAG